MLQRDTIHQIVKQVLTNDGWEITDDLFKRKVDLVSREFMSPYIRPYILAEVEYIINE